MFHSLGVFQTGSNPSNFSKNIIMFICKNQYHVHSVHQSDFSLNKGNHKPRFLYS